MTTPDVSLTGGLQRLALVKEGKTHAIDAWSKRENAIAAHVACPARRRRNTITIRENELIYDFACLSLNSFVSGSARRYTLRFVFAGLALAKT
jgi:hypothetical protein